MRSDSVGELGSATLPTEQRPGNKPLFIGLWSIVVHVALLMGQRPKLLLYVLIYQAIHIYVYILYIYLEAPEKWRPCTVAHVARAKGRPCCCTVLQRGSTSTLIQPRRRVRRRRREQICPWGTTMTINSGTLVEGSSERLRLAWALVPPWVLFLRLKLMMNPTRITPRSLRSNSRSLMVLTLIYGTINARCISRCLR